MSRPLSRPSFRPQLESLEGRELPSQFGPVLFFLTQPLTAQNTKVNNDFSTLQTDTNVIVNFPTAVPAATINSQATLVNTDRTTLQSDFTTLKNQAKMDQTLLFLGFASGQLDQSDSAFVFLSFQAITNANKNIQNLPGQVSSLGTTQLKNFGPAVTVNLILNSRTPALPSLSLS